jgi:hypothetical protein
MNGKIDPDELVPLRSTVRGLYVRCKVMNVRAYASLGYSHNVLNAPDPKTAQRPGFGNFSINAENHALFANVSGGASDYSLGRKIYVMT